MSGSALKEAVVVIKVQYDEDTRSFKLVDQSRTIVEGDALYDLAVPLMFEEGIEEDLIFVSGAPIAHA